jgi:hypothetical protein
MPRAAAALAPLALVLATCCGCRPEEATLEALSQSSAAGGNACALRRIEELTGAAPFPVESNPFISTDPQVIRFVSMWLLFPTGSEEEIETYEKESFEREAGLIDAVYVAVYEPAPGGPETGVYGLQFRDPIPEALRGRLEAHTAIVRGRLAVLVWSDAEDGTCYDAVRAHIEESLGR